MPEKNKTPFLHPHKSSSSKNESHHHGHPHHNPGQTPKPHDKHHEKAHHMSNNGPPKPRKSVIQQFMSHHRKLVIVAVLFVVIITLNVYFALLTDPASTRMDSCRKDSDCQLVQSSSELRAINQARYWDWLDEQRMQNYSDEDYVPHKGLNNYDAICSDNICQVRLKE